MSAFMINNETISRIANAYGKDVGQEPEVLARELYDLNVYALEERYSDGGKGMIQPFKYEYLTFFPNKWQQYKSLRCYLYQCSEGKAIDEPLFKRMTELSNTLAHRLAGDMADENGADWD